MIHAYVFTALACAAVAAFALPRWRGLAVAAAVLCMFGDFSLTYEGKIPVVRESELVAKEEFENAFENATGNYRVMVPISLNPEVPLSPLASRCNLMGYENAGGYVQVAVMDYYRFIHAMAGVEVPVMSRHTLNIDLFTLERVFSSKILGIRYALAHTDEGWRLVRASWYMPRAQLVHRARVVPDYRDHLPLVRDPGFNPQEVVLLEQAEPDHLRRLGRREEGAPERDSVRIKSYGPDRIEISASSASASYLVLSELFYPGWKAYVDGRRAPILRADYLLRAVPLVAGRHEVVVVYRPTSFMLGLGITAITLACLAVAWVWSRRKVPAHGGAASGTGGNGPESAGPKKVSEARRRGEKGRPA